MKRFFNLEGLDLLSYDEDTEEWELNDEVEGRMSVTAARLIMRKLDRFEMTPEDAASLTQSEHRRGEARKP